MEKFIGGLAKIGFPLPNNIIATATIYLIDHWQYLIVGVIAIGITQYIIIRNWKVLKYGTVLNAVLLILLMLNGARMVYSRRTTAEIHHMIESSNKEFVFTGDKLNRLPLPVRKWLQISNAANATDTRIELRQKGRIRSSKEAKWMTFDATQTYTLQPPAFIWDCELNSPFGIVAAKDMYANGRGNMRVSPLYIVNISDVKGPEVDQGTLVRFLAEMAWFPQAACSDYVSWEDIDSTHARAIIQFGNQTGKGIFTFNDSGFIEGFAADRFGTFDGIFKKEKWQVKMHGIKTFNNVSIPTQCDVTWQLKDGDFTWLYLEVIDLRPL